MKVKHADYRWLIWGVSRTPHGDLSPDVLARIAAEPCAFATRIDAHFARDVATVRRSRL